MAYNKITLSGKQVCDYIYIQDNSPSAGDFSYVNDEPSGWDEHTLMYANFNDPDHPLNAGNSELRGDILGYEIYRRKYNESKLVYVAKVLNEENVNINKIVDYTAKNNTDYIYYLYPIQENQSATEIAPLESDNVSIDVPFWTLFIVDETDDENVFYLDKMFNFELNLAIEEMNNNAQINITQNFTKYPVVQHGASNYWSGGLTSLCGIVSCNDLDYIQTANMIEEIKAITSSTKRKFLKDMDGNLWEVDVSAPISISTEMVTLQRLKTLRFLWVEVADASNVSIINNPNKNITEWVLTETGIALPYHDYIWDEQYVWDNSYIWTSNDITNLGRDIE